MKVSLKIKIEEGNQSDDTISVEVKFGSKDNWCSRRQGDFFLAIEISQIINPID